MAENDNNINQIIEKAYQLILEDRTNAIEAYEQLKSDLTNNTELAYFMGSSISNLLDTAVRSTANLVKLVQIIKRDGESNKQLKESDVMSSELNELFNILNQNSVGPEKFIS